MSWISDKYRGKHDERRKYENQYVFSAPTVLLLGAAGMTLDNVVIPPTAIPYLYSIAVALGGLVVVFLWSIHKSNWADIDRSEEAEKPILEQFGISASSLRRGWWQRWRNCILQSACVLVTAVTAAMFSHLVINARAVNQNAKTKEEVIVEPPRPVPGDSEKQSGPIAAGLASGFVGFVAGIIFKWIIDWYWFERRREVERLYQVQTYFHSEYLTDRIKAAVVFHSK